MSQTSIRITIPKPCHESWHSMDATGHGAFCHSCQKVVIDFSSMTDREIIEYISKNSGGCGRFRPDQLDTKLTTLKVDNGAFRWRAVLFSLLPLFSVRAFSADRQPPNADAALSPDTSTITSQAAKKTDTYHDTLNTSIADTLIELPTVNVIDTVHSRRMGEYTVYAPSQILPDTKSAGSPYVVKHLSRRQERMAWFRRLFRLD